MSNLEKESLVNLAKLCRINCSDKELEMLLNNLQPILKYIDQLKEIDTENTPVCDHIGEKIETFTREDAVTTSLDRTTFLENSPSHVGGMIRVPTVIKF